MNSSFEKPFWSVMIPTYNCANYLEQTLTSVLNQAKKHSSMEVQVVDDCSSDNPELIVEKFKDRGVRFYRQSKNVGATRNFNTCIERANGKLVHILHGDDYIADNFYYSLEKAFQDHPQLGLYSCRCFIIDENNHLLTLSNRIFSLENGSSDVIPFFYENPLRTPGVVIAKSVYDNHGFFSEDFNHVADWEMWVRSINKAEGIFINEPLAYYRAFSKNHTGRLSRSADNLRDYLKLAYKFKSTYHNFCFSTFKKMILNKALEQAASFKNLNDKEAFLNNKNFYMENANLIYKLKWFIKPIISNIKKNFKYAFCIFNNKS